MPSSEPDDTSRASSQDCLLSLGLVTGTGQAKVHAMQLARAASKQLLPSGWLFAMHCSFAREEKITSDNLGRIPKSPTQSLPNRGFWIPLLPSIQNHLCCYESFSTVIKVTSGLWQHVGNNGWCQCSALWGTLFKDNFHWTCPGIVQRSADKSVWVMYNFVNEYVLSLRWDSAFQLLKHENWSRTKTLAYIQHVLQLAEV